VLISEGYLRGEPFVMYLGDNVIADGITTLVDEYRRLGCNSQILLAKVPNPSQFGVAELQDGRVVKLTEKPKQPKSDLALVGVYMFDDSIWDAVKGIRPSARDELEITDAIQWLVDHGRSVHPHLVSGWWKDTGKIEDMLEANRIILDTFSARGLESVDGDSRVEGKVVVEPGAKLTRCTVRGPAVIGAGAEIRDAFVGPYTSIGPNCLIDRCEIENSIVLEDSRLERIPVRIADSLIGKNVRIHPGLERPRVHRFLVGDNAEIGIV
jgi:glucose-1-phosphate thymidylyltransferase